VLRAANELFLLDEVPLAAFDVEQPTNAVPRFVGADELAVTEHQFAEFVAVNKDVLRRLLPTATSIGGGGCKCHRRPLGINPGAPICDHSLSHYWQREATACRVT
jgi:hypothetical protein